MPQLSVNDFWNLPLAVPSHQHVRIYQDKWIVKEFSSRCSNITAYEALKRKEHPNITTPISIDRLLSRVDTHLFVVTYPRIIEYFNLYYLNACEYSTEQIIDLFYRILKALKEIHNDRLIINDLHALNIMVNTDLDFYFMDFNLSIVDGICVSKKLESKWKKDIAHLSIINKSQIEAMEINDKMCILSLLLAFLRTKTFHNNRNMKSNHTFVKNCFKTLKLSSEVMDYLNAVYIDKHYPNTDDYFEETVLKKINMR